MQSRARRGLPVLAIGIAGAASSWIPHPASALTLAEAIRNSVARNERAQSADQDARAAGARVQRARSFFLPDIVARGDFTRRAEEVDGDREPVVETLSGTIEVSQILFDAQSFSLLAQARHGREAARHDALEDKRRLAYETAEAYLATWNREQVARAAEQRLAFAERNLEEFRVRMDAALAGSNDVTRAELELASAERSVQQTRGAARTARLFLGYLIDAELTDSLATPSELFAGAERAEVAGHAGRREDIAAGRARVAALRASAREPLTRLLPDFGVSGALGITEEDDERTEEWSAGVGMSWELFDGGAREAERAERLALLRAAELDLANLERGVQVDLASARVLLEVEQASLGAAEAAVAAARRNAAETAELYRRGLLRALEVVDANVQLFTAEVERAGALYALALAYLDLRAAAGLDPIEQELAP